MSKDRSKKKSAGPPVAAKSASNTNTTTASGSTSNTSLAGNAKTDEKEKSGGPEESTSTVSLPLCDGPIDVDAPFPTEDRDTAAVEFKAYWNKRAEERAVFRESNLNVSYEDFEKLVKAKKLDSNLKKCTAFVRKMKQFLESQKTSMISDLNTLNLTKYQSEIAAMVVDGRLKLSEIQTMVFICSEVHKRYSEFSGHLLENLKRILPTKKTEVAPSVVSKLSSDIRFLAELLVGGILPDQEAFLLFLNTLKNMIFLDKDGVQFVIVFTSLLKGLEDDLIGVIPSDTVQALKEHGNVFKDIIRSNLLSEARKRDIKAVFLEYFDIVSSNVVKKHEELLKSEKYNRKLLTTRGEVPPDRLESHAELTTRFEKYQSNASRLAFLLDIPMPVLKELPPDPEDELEKALLTTDDGEVLTEVPGIVLFDNEETRQFYQDYPDLKVYLPPVVYRDNILQMQEKTKKLEETEKLLDEFDPDVEQAELQEEKETAEDEAAEEVDGDLPPSMRLDNDEEKENADAKENGPAMPQREAFNNFLDNLPNCVNKNMIDKAAIEFSEHHNNKRNRKELVRRLFLVPRQRTDLVPLYSRLVAILSKVFPDIGIDLSTMLQKDFRYLVLKKDQIKIETKLKITRFIAELVNFSVFQKTEAFNCFKMLLRNFTHHQVEMACAFVETCGKFLFRSSDSHRRMKIYLDEMLRKKTVKNMEPRYVYMIDCAYYYVSPASGSTLNRKKKTPFQAFMEYVLWEDLTKQTLERAVNTLKIYDWKDPQKFQLVIQILSSPWRFSYAQMDAASALIVAIKRFRPDVTIAVIENLTESIRLMCDYEYDDLNNHRMATAQYLANIYTYKGFSTVTLFNMWYYLISYGVTYNNECFTRMDAPDSLYRIRMICQMLRICGDYLTGTKSKKRLTYFLKYFQRFCIYKRNLPYWEFNEFPHSVQEMYEDTFKRLRGRWKWAKTVEEAEKEILGVEERFKDKSKNDSMKNVMKINKHYVRVASGHKRVRRKSGEVLRVKRTHLNRIEEEPEDDSPEGSNENSQKDDLYEQLENEQDKEKLKKNLDEEDEFESMLEQMMLEQNPATKHDMTDLPLPISASSSETSVGHVSFTLLSKKNNKQKKKVFSVPEDEAFRLQMQDRDSEKEEKERMKNRTIAITRMQEEEERREAEQTLSQLVFTRSPTKR